MIAGICGGDWDRVAQTMTLERVGAIREGWDEQGPPIHISLAVANGFKPKGSSQVMSPDDLEGFLAGLDH